MALKAAFVCAVIMSACTPGEAHRAETFSASGRATATVVDSARPMADMIARFQAGLPPIAAMRNASPSREALVRRFVSALASRDTVALASMLISRAEFAHLYFPGSALAAPPYELDPAFAWFQMELENERALRQALRRHGGAELEYRWHACTASPAQGQSGIWRNCRVTWKTPDGVVTQRAFMSIIEHRGTYKFFSFANKL